MGWITGIFFVIPVCSEIRNCESVRSSWLNSLLKKCGYSHCHGSLWQNFLSHDVAESFFWISSGLMIVANDLFKVLTPLFEVKRYNLIMKFFELSSNGCEVTFFCNKLKLFWWKGFGNTQEDKIFLRGKLAQIGSYPVKGCFNGFGFSCVAHVFKC